MQLEYNGRALAARALHLTTATDAASAPADDVASVITLVVVATKLTGLSQAVIGRIKDVVMQRLPFVWHMWQTGRLFWLHLDAESCSINAVTADLLNVTESLGARLERVEQLMLQQQAAQHAQTVALQTLANKMTEQLAQQQHAQSQALQQLANQLEAQSALLQRVLDLGPQPPQQPQPLQYGH